MTPSPSTAVKKEKILVVEGNPTFGQQIVDLLNKHGYEATLTDDAAQALKMVYDILPRLILLNVVLSKSDSYEMLEKKSAEPLLKKIPVFLMSTQGMPISVNRIPHGSMTEFVMLYKENADEVVQKIDKYLECAPSIGQNGEVTDAVPATCASKPSTGKSVLWVEDDKLIGTILSKKIISSGFNLIHVTNGDDAAKALSDTSVKLNLIILDLMLPGMTGFDILQKIDMDPVLKLIPVMILTNLDKQSDIVKAKKLGAKQYLVKASASLDQIVAEITRLCS
ncbi:MAG: response regulator [Candidatus Taylorbacteria bacterium]